MKPVKKKVKLLMGCVIRYRFPFLEKSARLVFEKLDYDLEDEPFTCCPDSVGITAISKKAWLTIGARNLTLGEKDNTEILSLCNGCAETLLKIKHELKHNKKDFNEINEILGKKGYKYQGNASVSHFVRTIYEDIGIKKIKAIVKETWANNGDKRNPVEGLKIASQPGCHYNKPSDILKWDDVDDPKYQDEIIRAIGGIPVNYKEKTLCCGSAVLRTKEDIGLELSKRKYQSIMDAGAKIISVNCPSCFQTLESNQRQVNKKYGTDYVFPTFYITELMALAFGFKPQEIGLKYHSVGKKMVFF
jgi:heterodisulfide reductase subunit B